jgi:two-component system, OmpR family, phosphate regulon sensor histidine kinase PhoR
LSSSKLKISSPYLPAFIASAVILLTFNFILVQDYSYLSAAVILVIFTSLYILIVRRRRKDMLSVMEVINRIRKNLYANPEDIRLEKHLEPLQGEIRLMFERIKGDIDYLRKLEKMRTEFIANVSHELRTPIFTIQGYIETLLNGALSDSEVSGKFLEKANTHTINLSNLVNDLINLSMIESGEMRMSFRYFNINSLINEVISEMAPLAEEKNLDLSFTPARENLLLFGDKTRLKQVLLNLIVNAVKYTDSGKIDVVVIEEEKTGLIIVKDTGIGIPEPYRERVFERFYRVDKARSKSAGGTGLGLAIVKHIIEAHGSVIELKSRENEGSEFYFRLKK